MNQVNDEVIYRVRAVASDHWVVYNDTARDPVASFSDKATALAYALDLARHLQPAAVVEYSSNVTGRQFGASSNRAPDGRDGQRRPERF